MDQVEQVAMGDRHPLGLAGGTRGIDHIGQAAWIEGSLIESVSAQRGIGLPGDRAGVLVEEEGGAKGR
ncbi:hypothetical protein ASE49_08070 [Novosphingobium sp. Leaf2]|nr:hypothetical protein ASE49_08070 [Novosphingobium sp. Leaf2]